MIDRTINFRSIQHYMYCSRRFALLEINNDWVENAFVIKGNIIHKNVDSCSHNITSVQKIERSSVVLFNDEPKYNIYGVADCIEFKPDKNGVEIKGLSGRYNVKIVEYKPRQPKDMEYHESDAIQVYAQKVCADSIWKCDCDACIYYADVKKRIDLPFVSKKKYYDNLLQNLLEQMRLVLENSIIPKKTKNQNCSGCSIRDVCFPNVKKTNFRDMIAELEKEYEKTS